MNRVVTRAQHVKQFGIVTGWSEDKSLMPSWRGQLYDAQLATAVLLMSLCLVQSSDRELWTFVSLNLALVYLRTNRHDEFMAVLNTVEPERLSNTS